MKDFVKRNFVLILGVSLPIVLVIIFGIAKSLTQLVDPPVYSAVFAIYSQAIPSQPYNFEVDENGKLLIRFKATAQYKNVTGQIAYNAYTRLFHFDPATGLVEQFDLQVPGDYEVDEEVIVEVPKGLAELMLLPDKTSPDGYVMKENTRSRNNLFTEIFGYGSRGYSFYVLEKDGRTIPVPQKPLFYGQLTFIGWVAGDAEQ